MLLDLLMYVLHLYFSHEETVQAVSPLPVGHLVAALAVSSVPAVQLVPAAEAVKSA